MFGPQRGNARWDKQRGPAQFEKNLARIECSVSVIAASNLLLHDDQIRTARFPRQCIARKIQRRSPFDALAITNDAPEPVSPLRQRRAHLRYISFRNLLYDHALGDEWWRNGPGRETDQRCIELPGKLRGNPNPLFRNTFAFDIDH
ncbi:hypothetical protein GALL_493880 [mine drainage metagenome]|uniref:Uncharacterized protein n=1 Tax=mine drainage metagenome TaxID=410659 RepID=A0A1J5PCG2_9ZZZZ